MRCESFPFSAVVGSDDLALALILTTVSPEVGGVLVRGEKGTAKTTMVRGAGRRAAADRGGRGLPVLLRPGRARRRSVPTARTFEPTPRPSPAGAAGRAAGRRHRGPGDRLAAPRAGARRRAALTYEPGLLAAAHRGILYVDEVNLLHDHLVDLLLDAAAMGRSTVERDGVSVAHAARFVLVGTMNPEEGELRPQLLDRFGLTVEVAAPRDPAAARRGGPPPAGLRRRPGRLRRPRTPSRSRPLPAADRRRPRSCSARSGSPTTQLLKIAEVCAAFEVDGMRADIVTARAAVAHAAWHGRTEVDRERHPGRRPAGAAAPAPAQPVRRPGARRGPARPAPRRRRAGAGSARPAGRRRRRRPGPDGQDRPRDGDDRTAADRAAGRQRSGSTPRPSEPSASEPAAPPADVAEQVADGRRAPTGPGCSPCAGVGARRGGPAQPGASPRAGARVGATVRPTAPGRSTCPRPSGRPRRTRTGAGARTAERLRLTATTCGSRDRGPRVQPGAVLRRRVRLDGRPQADGAVKTAVAVAAARRLPAPRQGRPGHLPRRRRRARAAADPLGRHRRPPARRPAERWPHAAGRGPALRRARPSRLERIRDPRRRPLLVVVTDGRATPGPDAVGRSRLVADQLRPSRRRLRWSIDCETGRFTARAWPPGSPRISAPSTSRSARSRADRARSTARRRGQGGLMPEGQPRARAGRRADHPAAPQPAAADRPHRRRQGEVDRRVRAGAARLEPGLVDRGLPVREVGQVADRRADRVRAPRPSCTTRPARAARSSGTRWAPAGRGSRKAGSEEDHAAAAAEGWAEIKRRLAAETPRPLRARRVHLPDELGLGRRRRRGRRPWRNRPGHQHVSSPAAAPTRG